MSDPTAQILKFLHSVDGLFTQMEAQGLGTGSVQIHPVDRDLSFARFDMQAHSRIPVCLMDTADRPAQAVQISAMMSAIQYSSELSC